MDQQKGATVNQPKLSYRPNTVYEIWVPMTGAEPQIHWTQRNYAYWNGHRWQFLYNGGYCDDSIVTHRRQCIITPVDSLGG